MAFSCQKLSQTLECAFNLRMRSSCQTLSNPLKMARKTPYIDSRIVIISRLYISCIIDSNWAVHESTARKPNWQSAKSLLLGKWLNWELLIIISDILPKTEGKLNR